MMSISYEDLLLPQAGEGWEGERVHQRYVNDAPYVRGAL